MPPCANPALRTSTRLSPTRLRRCTFPPTRGSHSEQCPRSSGECPRRLRFCSDPRTRHGKLPNPALADANGGGFVEMARAGRRGIIGDAAGRAGAAARFRPRDHHQLPPRNPGVYAWLARLGHGPAPRCTGRWHGRNENVVSVTLWGGGIPQGRRREAPYNPTSGNDNQNSPDSRPSPKVGLFVLDFCWGPKEPQSAPQELYFNIRINEGGFI